MKIRRIRIWLSKGWYRVLCSVSLLLLPLLCNTGKAVAATTSARQQSKDTDPVKKGDIIKGTVKKSDGTPFSMMNVTERDSLERIVAHAITDQNGEFAFKVVDPAHKLYIEYVGYVTQIFDFDRTTFEITMFERVPGMVYTSDDTVTSLPIKRSTEFDVVRVVAYGPPAASFRRYDDKVTRIVGPDFQSLGIETPDVSVMYGVPATRYVVTDDMQKPSAAPSYPLILLDGDIVNAPDDKLAAFDFNAVIMDRYQLAELVGTRGDKIKEARTINNKEAEEIWGVRGKNGVLEVFTRKYYRKFIKRVKTLHGTKQPITGLKNKE